MATTRHKTHTPRPDRAREEGAYCPAGRPTPRTGPEQRNRRHKAVARPAAPPAVGTCPYTGHCAAYADEMIDASRKGRAGFGCHEQTDDYRARHCKFFRANRLAAVLAETLLPPPPGGGAAVES